MIRTGKQSGLVDPEAHIAAYGSWLRQLAILRYQEFLGPSKEPSQGLGGYSEALEGS